MRKNNWLRILTWVAEGIILIDILLILVIPTEFQYDNFLWMVIYSIGIIISMAAAVTWLMVFFRAFFGTWRGWLLTILVMVISNGFASGVLTSHNANLDLLIMMIFIIGIWAIGVASAILLFYKDVSLRLVAWLSVVIIWTIVFSWKIQGNLIELEIQSINHPNEVNPLWWANPILCISGWMIPLAIASFIIHTGRIVYAELKMLNYSLE
jgi:hypothetical protein